MKRHIWLLGVLLLVLGLAGCTQPQTRAQADDDIDRDELELKKLKTIGDVAQVNNVKATAVSGVGLVCGLQGTGGNAPAGDFRRMLEDELHKKGVENVGQILESKNYAMVLVSALIPPGARIGDPLDIEVTLPPQSSATSLRGGSLYECSLMDYATFHTAQNDRLLKGHVLAKARGPLLVGFGEGSEDVKMRRGRIWSGGTSLVDTPFYLVLQNGQQFAAVANDVANHINAAFPDDARKQALVRQNRQFLVLDEVTSGINSKFSVSNGLGRGEAAHAVGKDVVYVNVPVEYRVNPARYVHVVVCIPLRDTAEAMSRYRNHLREMLLEPRSTVRAALRLEALGKESIPGLKQGLTSKEPLVRFASAEALTYLGTTDGMEELARLAESYDSLRCQCLSALASINESRSQAKLTELMKSSKPDLRIGAFRALLTLNEISGERMAGLDSRDEFIADSFWLHHVAQRSEPMVHVSLSQRAEIVVFGESPSLTPPFQISAGEFLVQAAAGDDRCTVTRYVVTAKGGVVRSQCSFDIDAILHTIAAKGGQYPDAVEFLRNAQNRKCLTTAVLFDCLPTAPDNALEVLAACGMDPIKFKDNPEFQQQVEAAQRDLGMTVGVVVRSQRQ